MKLFHLVLWRISLALIVVLTVWAGFFYMAVVEEVNDERKKLKVMVKIFGRAQLLELGYMQVEKE